MLKKVNEMKIKMKQEQLMNTIIPISKLQQMNDKLANEIQTVYQKQLEYEEQLRQNKLLSADYEQLNQELVNQKKRTTEAYINVSKTGEYLESIKNEKPDEQRINLMKQELNSKRLAEKNEREIEWRKRLNSIKEQKQANEGYLTELENSNLEGYEQLIKKKTEILKNEEEINDINTRIALTRKKIELEIDYNTRKKLYDEIGIITEFKEGNAMIQQYNYQQQHKSRILSTQENLHSQIHNMVVNHPNLWSKFITSHDGMENIYQHFTDYSIADLNNLGKQFYEYLKDYDDNNWTLS